MRFPKPRPAALERDDRRAARRRADEHGTAEARARCRRHGDVCEVRVEGEPICWRTATETHHMIGGIGSRAHGPSVLAEHKQRVCRRHHQEITSGRLRRVGGPVPVWTDVYERM